MSRRRSFFEGMASLLDGFASLGEGMASIFAPPRPYSAQTSRARLNATLRRQGLRPLASSVDEALHSDWDAIGHDFAAVGKDMHQVMRKMGPPPAGSAKASSSRVTPD